MWKHQKLRHLRAPADKTLMLANGQELQSLEELAAMLYRVDPDTFEIHVSPDKNDVADWVVDAFGLSDLATLLRSQPSPLRMMVHIDAFLRNIV